VLKQSFIKQKIQIPGIVILHI